MPGRDANHALVPPSNAAGLFSEANATASEAKRRAPSRAVSGASAFLLARARAFSRAAAAAKGETRAPPATATTSEVGSRSLESVPNETRRSFSFSFSKSRSFASSKAAPSAPNVAVAAARPVSYTHLTLPTILLV